MFKIENVLMKKIAESIDKNFTVSQQLSAEAGCAHCNNTCNFNCMNNCKGFCENRVGGTAY